MLTNRLIPVLSLKRAGIVENSAYVLYDIKKDGDIYDNK